jgi:predicted acyl esterase
MRAPGVDRRILAATLLCCLGTAPQLAAVAPSEPLYEIGMEEIWIPMPDGVRLAADLYLPQGAGPDERFPVLLEYLPYRKTESRSRNYSLYAYFIRRG